jgi:diadenosine tetraphosphate (Ap4A) HIT family hydrolase
VIAVDDPNYPGFCRVIWNEHVREMSDLSAADRMLLNDVVWHVETAVREVMAPDKINVASLGNVVPHLHWHVIPRYVDDTHFPNPVWAAAVREPDEKSLAARRAKLPRLASVIAERLNSR